MSDCRGFPHSLLHQDKEAQEAKTNRLKIGIDTVIVLDNSSSHKSHQVRAKEKEWLEMGLYLFFLPTYSPELNLIEGEWHQLKAMQRGLGEAARSWGSPP
ncbi:MAG: hypothetical protein F6K37_32155 [Moorea sp. SIO4E2]|uniref:transposase n=1 Tax=Moorena sp. SIO4E2 TaxID=2607826 RepID=UPI0013BB8662|nr:transposase [Moorena sp. SIO4E2]NEQ10418.1 hypothetical protein [Moorena sp. SIO4E2]